MPTHHVEMNPNTYQASGATCPMCGGRLPKGSGEAVAPTRGDPPRLYYVTCPTCHNRITVGLTGQT